MLRTNLTFLSFIERFCTENKEADITLKSFKAGYKFIEQGEKISNIYIIKDGISKCFISEENGKDFIIEFLGKGEVVGELEALKKITCLCNVAAISDVTAYVIPHHLFLSLINKNSEFTILLLQELSTRIIQTSTRASFQQLYTLEYALLKLLKLQADEHISISKEDMAAYLGISVRSFNRSLKQIITKGDFNTSEFKNILQVAHMKKLLSNL
ncbi:cAMP-binding domain of CRP or a regulatory subunit of cAMP-dependent protein kinases [Pedobacter suwonensis]|uniref:cAMP-binding domain of CRP or a regulatory subunit of cAMP-dependent protein kinases n=1 Tax=Pedobacter suwonensis TaxID=332999 RepID=A0A1I0TM54_9SPHI|nr:Crp/Fnr family transcriptional regulator [Pedobacter suwonensis]SFA52878.1 cAMP-binding domain of CRP or a regulatory subunit of cAMP-dependent protein kinases [Pedobacter suwonensis]